MVLYVETSNGGKDVVNVSTINQGNTCFKVELIDSDFYFDKLPGYKVEYIDAYIYHMTFDKDKYDAYLADKKKEQGIKEAEAMLAELSADSVLTLASDSEAYVMRYLYDPWVPNTECKVGDRRLYGDNLYKCKQAHTSQTQYTPDLVPALWDLINPDDTKGTISNPIPIPEPFSSMVYVKGKYYEEAGVIYLMNRVGMKEGEEISLTFKPSALVGQYFEVVNKQ